MLKRCLHKFLNICRALLEGHLCLSQLSTHVIQSLMTPCGFGLRTNSVGFEVCVREFLPFDGQHQGTIVVSNFIFFMHLELLHNVREFKHPLRC